MPEAVEAVDRRDVALGRLTSGEVAAQPILLVPLGSTEQHGPHLPLDTDTRIAAAVAHAVAADPAPPLVRGQVLVAPALPFGSSGEHGGFAGTLSIGAETTEAMLVELVRSATQPGGGPFVAVLILNGHGGNAAAVVAAVSRLVAEGRRVAAWAPSLPRADAHAGFTETSLALHPVSYTHLTLPTSGLVEISVVAVSLNKKKDEESEADECSQAADKQRLRGSM